MGSWLYSEINYANLVRKLFAQMEKFPFSCRVWKRRLIAIRLNDELAVIFDTRRKMVCGLLDAVDVNLANYMPMSLKVGASGNYRLNSHDNRPEVMSGIGLSVAIMCRVYGYFTADEYFVHHINNSCDNRRQMLQLVEPKSEHPPICLDSMVFMQTILSDAGYTLESVTAHCIKCIADREMRKI